MMARLCGYKYKMLSSIHFCGTFRVEGKSPLKNYKKLLEKQIFKIGNQPIFDWRPNFGVFEKFRQQTHDKHQNRLKKC